MLADPDWDSARGQVSEQKRSVTQSYLVSVWEYILFVLLYMQTYSMPYKYTGALQKVAP